MLKKGIALAFLLLLAAELTACGAGIQPCGARQSSGPCSIGGHKDSSA